jgi:hypothetical protein
MCSVQTDDFEAKKSELDARVASVRDDAIALALLSAAAKGDDEARRVAYRWITGLLRTPNPRFVWEQWVLVVACAVVCVFYWIACCPLQRHHVTGLVIALPLGHVASFAFWWPLHQAVDARDGGRERTWWFPAVLGFVERLFFLMLIASGIGGVGGGLATWTALKLVNGWGRLKEDSVAARLRSMSAVLTGLVSLGFAVAGGIVWKDGLPVWWSFSCPWHCAP